MLARWAVALRGGSHPCSQPTQPRADIPVFAHRGRQGGSSPNHYSGSMNPVSISPVSSLLSRETEIHYQVFPQNRPGMSSPGISAQWPKRSEESAGF